MTPSLSELPVWTEQLSIRSYDADYTQRATSAVLCRYFFEAAWNHAEALGVGFSHLGRDGKFWVLSRLVLEVRQYPLWGTTATLRTWPRGVKGAFAMRDFEFTDGAGAPFAAGSSAWLVLDAQSKRPQRINKLFPSLVGIEARAVLGRDPEKVELGVGDWHGQDAHATGMKETHVRDGHATKAHSTHGQDAHATDRETHVRDAHATEKVADDGIWDEVSEITVRYSDIDVNRHANSARYIGWILDSYPAGFHHNHWARVLEVNYLGETMESEALMIRTRRTGDKAYIHSLAKGDGDEVCRARLEWE